MKLVVLILIAALVVIVAFSLLGLYQAMLNFQPGPSRIKADVNRMIDDLAAWTENLVPVNKAELELLSHNQLNNSVSKKMILSAKGVITSIYDEPMIAYAYKRYLGSTENSVLYARTANQEIIYRMKHGSTKITYNNQALGELKEDGILYNAGTKKPVAQFKEGLKDLRPLLVDGREVANYKANDKSVTVNSRALEFVSDLKPEEEMVLLTLVVRELVREDLPLS